MCRCPEKSKVITQNKKIISLSQCIVWALTHTAKVSAELSQDISMLLMNKNALQNAIFDGNVLEILPVVELALHKCTQ